jgi:hypothetical protein
MADLVATNKEASVKILSNQTDKPLIIKIQVIP